MDYFDKIIQKYYCLDFFTILLCKIKIKLNLKN